MHLVYYDTQNSVGRSGVDLYYQFSRDGGVNWHEPVQVTSMTSTRLDHWLEWGDHNGLATTPGGIIATWTDNREGNASFPRAGAAYAARIATVLFADGFESGDLSHWSASVP